MMTKFIHWIKFHFHVHNSVWVVSLSLLLLVPSMSHAEIPQMINYQGRLTDSNNSPRNGSVSMTFKIFDSLTLGTELWTETQSSINVSKGIFSAQLGSVTPISETVFNQSSTYLQITVNGETLSPRQRLLSSPYAFNAQRLGNKPLSDFVIKDVSGNVGIGTANPLSKLDVNGEIRATNVTADNIFRYLGRGPDFNYNNLTGAGSRWIDGNGTVSNGPIGSSTGYLLQFENILGSPNHFRQQFAAPGSGTQGLYWRTSYNSTWNGWNKFVLENPSGNVGIGTNNPGAKLDVNNGTGNDIIDMVGGTNSKRWTFQITNSNYFQINENGVADRLTINNSGNIGIGTTVPGAKLEVVGDFIRTIARAQGYNQQDGADTGALSTRILTFVKKRSDTGVRVTYSDNRRVVGPSKGGRWEAKFNGSSCSNPGPMAWDQYQGGSINHHEYETSVGTCFGLPAGTYTIQIYVDFHPEYGPADLYTGWKGAWSLEAEEVR